MVRRKLVNIFVCLLLVACMLMVSAVVVAPRPPEKPGKPGGDELGTEYQITFSEDGGEEWANAIYGNIMIWQSYNFQYQTGDIYMFDLGDDGIPYTEDDGEKTGINNDPTTSQMFPGIWENRIVYTSDENGNYNVFLYEIDTGVTTQITDDPKGQWSPQIWGDIIVYVDNRNGNRDVYAYDLGTGTEIQITTDTANQQHPYIYGDIVVWTDYRDAVIEQGMDIYMYKFSTGLEYAVTNDDFTQSNHYIRDNKIVWSDDRNEKQGRRNDLDIYMYDLGPDGIPFTGDLGEGEYQITSGGRMDFSPKLYGDLVALRGKQETGKITDPSYKSKDDIYICNINSGVTNQITNSNKADYPSIFEDHIVYADERDGTNHIYLFILNP